jgi:hypothetical protein
MNIVKAITIAALLAGSTICYAQDSSNQNAREFRAYASTEASPQTVNDFVHRDADYHYPSDGLHPRPGGYPSLFSYR